MSFLIKDQTKPCWCLSVIYEKTIDKYGEKQHKIIPIQKVNLIELADEHAEDGVSRLYMLDDNTIYLGFDFDDEDEIYMFYQKGQERIIDDSLRVDE